MCYMCMIEWRYYFYDLYPRGITGNTYLYLIVVYELMCFMCVSGDMILRIFMMKLLYLYMNMYAIRV